jgi:hypothetical protein
MRCLLGHCSAKTLIMGGEGFVQRNLDLGM